MTAPRYSTILFDLDDTLLDSVESARLAFDETLGSRGLDPCAADSPQLGGIKKEIWGKGENQ